MFTKGVAGSFLDGVSIPVFFKNGVAFFIGPTSGVSGPLSFLESDAES